MPRLIATERAFRGQAPALGVLGGAVLRELLSRDEAQIAALRAESVI